MFDCWLAFGGIEVASGPRARAYLNHVAPSVYVNGCCDCDLATVNGEAPYSSPMQDDAPWFNAYNSASQEFLGVWPLAMEGFEDSTREVPVVELMGDGSSFGRPRRAGRDLRIRALMVAESEKGMSYGMTWLRGVLEGSGCTDCQGEQLCYFTDCPDEACLPEFVEAPLDVDYGPMTPAAAVADAARWSSTVTPTVFATSLSGTSLLWDTSGASISTVLTGLLPGATYRVEAVGGSETGYVSASTVGLIDAEVSGAPLAGGGVDSSDAFGYLAPPTNGGAWWVFRAVDETATLTLKSTTNLVLRSVRVERVAQGQVVLNSYPKTRPEEYWPWTPLLPLGTLRAVLGTFDYQISEASPTVASAAGTVGLTYRLTSLVQGGRYRVTALVRSEDGFSAAAIPGRLGVQGSTSFTTFTPTTARGSTKMAWVTHDFTAASNSVVLALTNSASLDLNSPTYWALGVRAVRVERLDVEPELPDPVDEYRRYLRNVVLTSGPTVTQVFPHLKVAMREVEWTMRAGVPTPFGEPVVAVTSLGAGILRIPEIDCSLGEPVRINLVSDPSGQYGTSMFTAAITNATTTSVTSPTAKYGTKVVRVTATSAVSSLSGTPLAALTVTPGSVLAMSAWVRASKSSQVFLRMTPRLAAGTANGQVQKTVTVGPDWRRIDLQLVVPAGTATVDFLANMAAPSGNLAVNDWFEWDGWLIERSTQVGSFFDGDSPNSFWTGGTPGVGSSTFSKTDPDLVFDPECPPPPAPPRAPTIDSDCVTTPTQWLRYALEVPAEATSLSQAVVPTITVTTGATEARGIRVRVYANPFSRSVAELDECAYCGEFLVSYLPPNATLEVDSAVRTATVTTVQGSQTATSLLYGSGGSPMTWPVLECGLPYLVVVDLDAADPPLVNASLAVTPVH